MFDRFGDDAKKLMSLARQHAVRLQHDAITPEHLLLGLLSRPECGGPALVRALGADPDAVAAALERRLVPGARPTISVQMPFTHAAKRVLEQVLSECSAAGASTIHVRHLLAGIAAAPPTPAAEELQAAGITVAAVRALVEPAAEPEPRDDGRRRLLLISNSTMHGGGYLAHCAAEIRDFLGARKRVMFVPFALHDHDSYAARAEQAFAAFGHELSSVHRAADPRAALAQAEAVFIGGGNTFGLLRALYATGLLEAIAARARAGMPYVGSSAGTNVATLSIRTTNDMPIVQPPSFTAMALVPFQINPHYLDPEPGSTHMGETREERLRQFLEEHSTPVLGLREGCLLRVEGHRMELRGTTRARLFRRDAAAQEFTPPADLSFLLRAPG